MLKVYADLRVLKSSPYNVAVATETHHEVQPDPAYVGRRLADGVRAGGVQGVSVGRRIDQVGAVLAGRLTAAQDDWQQRVASIQGDQRKP